MARTKQILPCGLAISAVVAVVGAALAGTAHAATLAIGPVEQVNLKTSTLVVLGQTYHVDAATVIKNRSGAAIALGSLAPNTLVTIEGIETATSQAAVESVSSLPQLDIPGATPLLVTGVVSAETPTGQIKVGGLTVDIVATLTSDTPKFQVGNMVEVTGTQPNPDGLFLAETITPISGVSGGGASTATLGVSGGGASTATLGVSGGGASTATLGVSGGGKK